MRREDQVNFGTEHVNDGCCAGAFNTIGVMPPTEDDFKPGDLVHYYDRPDCVGLIAAVAPQEVEYAGLSTLTKENIFRREDGSISCKHGKATINFYTIVWNTGAIRTAGAHMLHQLRHVK